MNSEFTQKSLEEFSGCDNGKKQAGSAEKPSIWLFGIEFGTYKSVHDENENTRSTGEDSEYSIEQQSKFPYNLKAFKLLASIYDYRVEDYWELFAKKYRPFETNSTGFFKGNLFPYPCRNVGAWSDKAKEDTGFASKNDCLDWCRKERLPAVKSWIKKYQPKVFIGVGISHKEDFSRAVFGEVKNLTEKKDIIVNGHTKRLFYHIGTQNKLVVIPHFSSPSGLNSDESLQKTGQFIAGLL